MALNLSKLKIKQTFDLHLAHPVSGELLYADGMPETPENAVVITLASQSSKEWRQATAAMNDKRVKRGKKQPTAAQIKEEGVDLLTAICLASKNLNSVDEDLPIQTQTQFKTLLSDDDYSWIKNQIDEALGDNANFID